MIFFRVTQNINIKTTDGTMVNYFKFKEPSNLENETLYISTYDDFKDLREIFSKVDKDKYFAKVFNEEKVRTLANFPIELGITNVDEYNKLLEILENMIDSDNENYSNKSSKMKDKLLRYSVPITEEDGTTIVDMRFYNNEIVDLFMILFYEMGNIPINTNYYEVLLSVREKIKKSKMSEE